MALAAPYFRSEEFILMAFIQIYLRGQRRNLALTHGGLTVSDSDVEEGEKWHRREKVPLMILNQTQPFPVSRLRAAHTLSIYGDGICMEGKPGLMDQERC